MRDLELSNPAIPFIETWAFSVSLTQSAATPVPPLQPWGIRQRAVEHLQGHPGVEGNPNLPKDVIRQEVYELVGSHLSSPDYHYFVADFEEHPGSWEITFLVVGAFYGGVCGYGSFRQGLEYVYSDLKATFSAIQGVAAKVRKRHRDRHVLSRKVDPTLE